MNNQQPFVVKMTNEVSNFIRQYNVITNYNSHDQHIFGTFCFKRNDADPEGEYKSAAHPVVTGTYFIDNGWKPIQRDKEFNRMGFEKDNLFAIVTTKKEQPYPIIEILFKDPSIEDWYWTPEFFRIVVPGTSVLMMDMILQSLKLMKP